LNVHRIPTGVDAGSMVALARERLSRLKPVKRQTLLMSRKRWPRRPQPADRLDPLAAWAELRRPAR
jgi:hypothetical protein